MCVPDERDKFQIVNERRAKNKIKVDGVCLFSPHVTRMLHVVEGEVHLGVFAQRASKVTHRQVQVMGRWTHFRILATSGRQSGVPLVQTHQKKNHQ